MSADRLIREVELLVSRLESFVDEALASHREYCSKLKTRDYPVERCTSALARALLVVVRGYVNRNINPRLAKLTQLQDYSAESYYTRLLRALAKLRQAAETK
jgi:hypothetical protein